MFEIPEDKKEEVAKWLDDQWNKIVELHKGRPNIGAIGGVTTYSFTPTSLGTVIKIKNCITNEELDITDYDMW